MDVCRRIIGITLLSCLLTTTACSYDETTSDESSRAESSPQTLQSSQGAAQGVLIERKAPTTTGQDSAETPAAGQRTISLEILADAHLACGPADRESETLDGAPAGEIGCTVRNSEDQRLDLADAKVSFSVTTLAGDAIGARQTSGVAGAFDAHWLLESPRALSSLSISATFNSGSDLVIIEFAEFVRNAP